MMIKFAPLKDQKNAGQICSSKRPKNDNQICGGGNWQKMSINFALRRPTFKRER